jgi:hypothetical protein
LRRCGKGLDKTLPSATFQGGERLSGNRDELRWPCLSMIARKISASKQAVIGLSGLTSPGSMA